MNPPEKKPDTKGPALDATSGKSYDSQNQTAGVLGGRRAVQRWFYETVPPVGCG